MAMSLSDKKVRDGLERNGFHNCLIATGKVLLSRWPEELEKLAKGNDASRANLAALNDDKPFLGAECSCCGAVRIQLLGAGSSVKDGTVAKNDWRLYEPKLIKEKNKHFMAVGPPKATDLESTRWLTCGPAPGTGCRGIARACARRALRALIEAAAFGSCLVPSFPPADAGCPPASVAARPP